MSPGFQTSSRSEVVRNGIETQEQEQGVSRSQLLKHSKAERLPPDQATLLHPIFGPQDRLVSLTGNGSLGAEKFSLLSMRLKYLQDQHQVQKVVLTSSMLGEGKSLVAANLAISLARGTKQKVLLLEGDLRRPVLSQLLAGSELKGLSELLHLGGSPAKFLYRMAGLPVWVLFAGTLREHPLELLQSSQLPQLLDQFTESFDWILIDAPPLLPLADADLWTRLSDGVLLVIRENKTRKKILQKALDTLKNATLLGLVLNEAAGLDQSYYEDSQDRTAAKNHRRIHTKNGAPS
ncbi:MAG TPA: CpsD/CapB family tyrosine-protein kinase [Terriglobales bacterium]|nr:CpsD/CapB family tyrosine-protein kinase [Terriglobales bacterium]